MATLYDVLEDETDIDINLNLIHFYFPNQIFARIVQFDIKNTTLNEHAVFLALSQINPFFENTAFLWKGNLNGNEYLQSINYYW